VPAPSYTTCFHYAPPDKPFNKQRDMVPLLAKNGTLGAVFGVLTGLATGLLIGGPAGAVIGAVVGAFAAGYTATAMIITETADKWLHHRLVCLTGDACAIGAIKKQPTISTLGDLDNDQFFNFTLMPYPHDQTYDVEGDPDDKPGTQRARAILVQYPANIVFDDRFQGTALVRPDDKLLSDLGYCAGGDEDGTNDRSKVTRNWIHVEAEGDFWVRMNDLASAMGVLGGLDTAGAVGGGIGGGVAGCAIGGALGLIGCIIGAIIGAIIGFLAAAAAAKAITDAILQSIFETKPGSVEDANVGDKPLGTLKPGDRVVLYGRHVYDGFHAGWHEIHPLLTIVRVSSVKLPDGRQQEFYLQWDPDLHDPAPDLRVFDPTLPALTPTDVQQGLGSATFRKCAEALKERSCNHLRQPFDAGVAEAQQQPEHRWTIHPSVDGCRPTVPAEPGPR
jgi:hypothetical protein